MGVAGRPQPWVHVRVAIAVAAVVVQCASGAPAGGSTGLTVEVFANSVMRGTPRCTAVLPNGFNEALDALCPSAAALGPPGWASARVTGTLSADGSGWRRFAADVDELTWIRLWVDDHRLVDQWGSHSDPSPVTPGLLPNVSMDASRPVFVRVDLRPWSGRLALGVKWTADPAGAPALVPASALSPAVSAQQQQRRALQESASTGWNQWIRNSNLAQVVLPQQVGVDLGVLNASSGKEFRGALLNPQFHNAAVVRMGHHAFDGSFSSISFAPPGLPAVNFTIESGTTTSSGSSGDAAGAIPPDNVVVVSTNATAADAESLAVIVHPSAFWGAATNISVTGDGLALDCGELGTVSVTFSQAAHSQNPRDPTELLFNVTAGKPLVFWMTFGKPSAPDAAKAAKVIEAQRAATLADISAAAAMSKSSFDVVDAMSTAIAWNVNFDPRVAVTAPVSRTFEAGFDFIFFDWDMFFLSLMAASLPAAANPHAFAIGVSNLVEVAQTRSAYGQVMNKRAARGSGTSDTNDRTEPYVGSTVVLRLVQDAKGTPREATMQWVAKLLFPTLLRWNQWCWETRRYFGSGRGAGLLVLGSDNTLPCEGSTVGLNTSRKQCSSVGAAILESGMDNSPMYYNSFYNATTGKNDEASWDAAAGRVQLYDVQMSSLFVAESEALQTLATLTGNTGAVAQLKQQSSAVAGLVNSVLWDDATGVYRQVDASPMQRGFSPRLSPTSFYPMISGTASAAQAQRLVAEHLTNESEFCVDGTGGDAPACPYALPSIARNDPYFFDNTYWRGRTWGPLNLLVWLGLSHPSYAGIDAVSKARKGLCRQSEALLLKEFSEKRHVHENYNSTNGVGCDVDNSNPFYHWGALLGYIGIRENMAAAAATQ